MLLTNAAPILVPLWKLIELYGADPAQVFGPEGIELENLTNHNARISKHRYFACWERAQEMIEDGTFGLRIAETLHPSYLGAMGYAWLASNCLRTGFVRLSRFGKLLATDVHLEIQEDDEFYKVTVLRSVPLPRSTHSITDSSLAFFVWLCRLNSGTKFSPVKVAFQHAAIKPVANYRKFFQCPVEFDCLENSLTFSMADIDRKLTTANPYLANIHDQVMIKAIKHLDKKSFSNLVRASILDALPSGRLADEITAQDLEVSVRSFQRRLASEGTTYNTILSETRREIADAYLSNHEFSISEIAFQLGFSEVSAFSNAYKRWTGISPSLARLKVS